MSYTQDLLRFGVSLLIFWLVVFLLGKILPLKYYGVEVKPAYVTLKSSRFKALLYRISEKRRFFWRILSNLSIVFGVGLTIYAIYFLLDNLLKLVEPGAEGAPVLPVLPGLTIRLYWLPYLLLAVSSGVIAHEAAHGVIARIENISLKSAGLAFVLAFPAGFVEPDEGEFEDSPTLSKLRVVSVGSFVNLVMFLIVLFIMSALFVDAPAGIVVTEVMEGSPIQLAGVQPWDVVYDINGTLRDMGYNASGALQNLTRFIASVIPGETLELTTSRGVRWMVVRNSTKEKPLGVLSYWIYYPSKAVFGPLFDVHLWFALLWGEIVYSSLAILNMLPLFPFDGEKFVFYMIERFAKERSKEIRIVLSAVFLGIIAGNMILSFIKYGPFLF